MKTLEWVLENYENVETTLDVRLGKRLCQFLTKDQMRQIGFELEDENKEHTPLPWTEENILKQLRDDVEFGIEKATSHRGISASLMWEVCMGWCTILENGLDEAYKNNYGWYGDELFGAIDQKYNFGLVNSDTFDDGFYEKW